MESHSTTKAYTPFYVLIAAGGSGFRAGGNVPKQYRKIGGKALLRRTIDAFLPLSNFELCKIIVAINPDHTDLYNDAVAGLDLSRPVHGGSDRQESVRNGLAAFDGLNDNDIVLIHDAARPFITAQEIQAVIAAAAQHGAATLAAPVADTLRYQEGGYADREGLWAVQTPQAFQYGLIRRAHEKAKPGKSYTDDTALVEELGSLVTMVPGSRANFKITTEDDFMQAEKMIAAQMETRTGTGFDVHAFDKDKPGPVMLCGVAVDHPHALAGHSDADVGLHALTDALLGAMAAGDIGQHFPPSDPQWKGKDSAHFLRHAVDMLGTRSGSIVNLDLTLICEAPKAGPHREAMQKRVAEICGIDAARIGIKATTTEKLGFTGRGEGIAAQATATIKVPA